MEGNFLPCSVLPSHCTLEAVGFHSSSQGGRPEPAWKYTENGKSKLLISRKVEPVLEGGESLYIYAMEPLHNMGHEKYLGRVCQEMSSVLTAVHSLPEEEIEQLFASGRAKELVSQDYLNRLLSSAGPSLEDQWTAISVHQMATLAANALKAEAEGTTDLLPSHW